MYRVVMSSSILVVALTILFVIVIEPNDEFTNYDIMM